MIHSMVQLTPNGASSGKFRNVVVNAYTWNTNPVTATGQPEQPPHLLAKMPNTAPPTTSPIPMKIPDSPTSLFLASPMPPVKPMLDEYTPEKNVNTSPVYRNVNDRQSMLVVQNSLTASQRAFQAATKGFSLAGSGILSSLSTLEMPSASPRMEFWGDFLMKQRSKVPPQAKAVSTLKTTVLVSWSMEESPNMK